MISSFRTNKSWSRTIDGNEYTLSFLVVLLARKFQSTYVRWIQTICCWRWKNGSSVKFDWIEESDDWMETCLDTVWNVYFGITRMAWRNIFVKKSSKISRQKHFEIMMQVNSDEIYAQESYVISFFRSIVWSREILGFSQILQAKNKDQSEIGNDFEKL